MGLSFVLSLFSFRQGFARRTFQLKFFKGMIIFWECTMLIKTLSRFPYRQILFSIVLLVLGGVYIRSIPAVDIHFDESHWIHTSVYWEIFTSEKADSPFWGEHYWTLTQPPVARYIIGIGPKAWDFEPAQLNKSWDFAQSYAENVAQGRLPSDGLLFASRLPMAILAALTGTIVFGIVWEAAGLGAASGFVLLYSFSTYFKTHLVRAMGESPLLFFMIAAGLFTFLAIKALKSSLQIENSGGGYRKPLFLFFVSGIACGLAGASKINGLVACAGVVVLAVGSIFLLPSPLDRDHKIKLAVRIIFLIALAAVATFILLNPYLYRNLIQGMGRMYKFRLEEMALQIQRFPESHIDSLSERISLLFEECFSTFMPFHFLGAKYIYLGLVLLGLLASILEIVRWLSGGMNSPAIFVLIFILLPLVMAGYMTPLNWERYLLPCVMLNMICVPVGVTVMGKKFLSVLSNDRVPEIHPSIK